MLSTMIVADEDALICDLAETYGLYDIYSVPLNTLATFAIGLGANSRIKLKLRGQIVSDDTLLLASMVDRLSWLVWAKTEDARNGQNRPASIVERLIYGEPQSEIEAYEDGDELLARIAQIKEEANNARYR